MDVVFAVLLCLSLYKGLKNGLFVEVASLVALIVGIFLALKFSYLVQGVLETKVSWEPKYIQISMGKYRGSDSNQVARQGTSSQVHDFKET